MQITVTLSENEIIEILRKHFTEKGFEVYDWQIYDSRVNGVNADIRVKSDDIKGGNA